MSDHEHHFRNLGRARDHLTETIVSLRSAIERMTGDDWIDATALLQRDHRGHRAAARAAADRARPSASTSTPGTGTSRRCAPAACRSPTSASLADAEPGGASARRPPDAPPPRLDAPNAKIGADARGQARRDRRGDDGLRARQPRVRSHPGVPLRQQRASARRAGSRRSSEPDHGLGSLAQRRRERQHRRPLVRAAPAAATSPRPARGGSSPRGRAPRPAPAARTRPSGWRTPARASLAHTGQAIDAGAVPIGRITSNAPSRSHRYS